MDSYLNPATLVRASVFAGVLVAMLVWEQGAPLAGRWLRRLHRVHHTDVDFDTTTLQKDHGRSCLAANNAIERGCGRDF